MLALLPVMIASGLLAVLVSVDSGPPGHRNGSDEWLVNMALAHHGTIDAAMQRGFAGGPVQSQSSWPFRDLGGWIGEVVVGGGQTVVLTWPSAGNIPDQVGRRLAKSFPLSFSPARGGGREFDHFVGGFKTNENGIATVGDAEIPSPSTAISVGTAVMGTRILK